MRRIFICLLLVLVFNILIASNNYARFLSTDPADPDYEDPYTLNSYIYTRNNPLKYVDPTGEAYFALRPLEGFPWLGVFSNNPIDDQSNTEIAHEQLFFEDELGGNMGYFKNSKVLADAPNLIDQYRVTKTGYDDAAMRDAVLNVEPEKYKVLGNNKYNCQDWAEAVRFEYNRLVIELQNTMKGNDQ